MARSLWTPMARIPEWKPLKHEITVRRAAYTGRHDDSVYKMKEYVWSFVLHGPVFH
jgi:hypothetical protein